MHLKTPLISVIIPVYNVAQYLPRCLDSICNQTYQNLEIILIDDGSTDSSLEICQQYAQKDPRIRVFHQENSGVCAARNRGLDCAKGDFVCFVDSDDWLDENFYQHLVATQQKTSADVLCGTVFRTAKTDIGQPLSVQPEIKSLCLEDFLILSNQIKDYFSCSKLFSRNILHHHFTAEHQLGEDWDFLFKIVLEAKQIVSVKHAVYFYYQHANAATRTLSIPARSQALEVWKNTYEICCARNLSKALVPILHTTIGTASVLVMTILLQDTQHQFSSLLQKTHQWLLPHKAIIWENNTMGFPGKFFISLFIKMPKMLSFCCQLPGIRQLLKKIFISRLLS